MFCVFGAIERDFSGFFVFRARPENRGPVVIVEISDRGQSKLIEPVKIRPIENRMMLPDLNTFRC